LDSKVTKYKVQIFGSFEDETLVYPYALNGINASVQLELNYGVYLGAVAVIVIVKATDDKQVSMTLFPLN